MPDYKVAMAPRSTHACLGGNKHRLKDYVFDFSDQKNAMMDSDSLEDEMGENRVYSEQEKVQQRIDLGLVTSDPPYMSSVAIMHIVWSWLWYC